MSRHVIDLSAFPWQMGRVARQPFTTTPNDDMKQVEEWLCARVPGDVRADLIANGRIPGVGTPEGIAAGAWVDRYDWWYQTRLPAREPGQVAILEADGIDYYSAIWLGGTCLGTHAGMFGRQSVPLPGETETDLAIRIWGNGALPHNARWRRATGSLLNRLHPGLPYLSDRMAVPKAQFGFGWDFAPRLLSNGIWDGIRLAITRGAYIEDLWAHGEPLVPGTDPTPVRWRIRLRISRWQPGPVSVQIAIRPANFPGKSYETVHRMHERCTGSQAPCTEEYQLELDMAAGRLWWPWDQGEPLLYEVTVTLLDDDGILDEISRVSGVRTVRRDRLPDGSPWRFVINDRPLFLRGANWVPADMLPGRVLTGDYERLIGLARDAGINFLRVWGGGLREKQGFWDTCDRLGMMAWQEFPLACDFFDRYPISAAYLQPLSDEAEGIVRALRGHPSLIAWCGGNEIDVEREATALRLLEQRQADLDGTRPWIPASPSQGDVHRWDTWHGLLPWPKLADTNLPFMSEFGFQAPPNEATLAEIFGAAVPGRWTDRRWVARKAQVSKLRYYAAAGDDVVRGVEAMQRVQATALQVGIEACRLRRETCGGVAFWQFNEPWPAVSWAIVDHAGRSKRAYEAVKGCCQPLLVAARFPWTRYGAGDDFVAELWIVNDGPGAETGCELEIQLDGVAIARQTRIDVPRAGVLRVGQLRHRLAAAPSRLELCLWRREDRPENGAKSSDSHGQGAIATNGQRSLASDGQGALARNCYDLGVPLASRQPLAARVGRRVAGWARRIT